MSFVSDREHAPHNQERALSRAEPTIFAVGDYVILRNNRGEAWAGEFVAKFHNGSVAVRNARRIIPDMVQVMRFSDVAIKGVAVDIPAVVPLVEIRDVVEIIMTTAESEASIRGAAVAQLRRSEVAFKLKDEQEAFEYYHSTFGT